jgi:hypothetical protein
MSIDDAEGKLVQQLLLFFSRFSAAERMADRQYHPASKR